MTNDNTTTVPTTDDTARLEAEVAEASQPFRRLQEQMHRVIVGQQELLDGLIVGLLANGHLLIEGVPGLAKTTAIASLAKGIRTEFKRIQFTPDLLPADLIGTLIRGRLRREDRPDLLESDSGGRDQPRASQGAVGIARSHAGTTSHHR